MLPSSPALRYRNKFFALVNFTYFPYRVYPTLHSHRTEAASENERGGRYRSSCAQVTLPAIQHNVSKAILKQHVQGSEEAHSAYLAEIERLHTVCHHAM